MGTSTLEGDSKERAVIWIALGRGLASALLVASLVCGTGVMAAEPSPTDATDGTWTWWHVVAGEWRAWERDGAEPTGGVERTATDVRGEVATHAVRDPGPGLLADPEGDGAGAGGPADRRVADVTFVEAYPSISRPGALYVALEIVGPAPDDGDAYLTYGWVFDTGGDGEADHGLAGDAATGSAWVADLATGERRADPDIDAAAYEDTATATLPMSALGDADLADVRVRGQVLLGRGEEALAYDIAPDVGWLRPARADEPPEPGRRPPGPAPSAPAEARPTGTWTWWHVVRGEWRSRRRPGPEPTGGVERTARDEHGRRVGHVVRDPGAGLAVDPAGDASGSRRARDLRIADLTFVEARAAGSRALTLTSEVVGPAPRRPSDADLIWTWEVDVDADGEWDQAVYASRGGIVGLLDRATGASRPDGGLPIDVSAGRTIARATVPLALLGDPVLADVRVRGLASLCRPRPGRDSACADDRAPDDGWLAPSGTDVRDDPLADAVPVYRAVAAGLGRAWARRSPGPYKVDDWRGAAYYVRTTIEYLAPYGSIAEVGGLVRALRSVEDAGEGLEANGSDELAFVVPWAMANEVGPLADAARERLGLHPRADGEPI